MTAKPNNKPNRDSIFQLLSGIGASRPAVPAPPCEPLDWRQSHYFTAAQLKTLETGLGKLAQAQAQALSQLCGSPFEMNVTAVTQHYASELLDSFSTAETSGLFHAFGPTPEEVVGVLVLTPEHARAWVELLMGPSDGEDSADALSAFELSLLGDVTKTVIRAWTQLGDTYGFQAHADGVCEGLVLPWDRAGHLCQVTCTLTRKTEGDEDEGPNSEVRFVLPCEAVAALAEKVTIVQQMSPEQVSQTIAQRLQDYPVCIRGEVGRTTLRFQEIMELREQDVVVLDRSIREPIDVVVVGRSVFRAVLGQSQGRQALQIVAAPARGESVS